ncbi:MULTISPECIES: CPBP family intramembrane glutamic endopeptidase [Streptococcus]|jgi:infAE-imm|uniref:CPBP family intramembrane glutamic endopeptidase n=1 Tax=Streptococcus TaxID=1301 RepID=UPI00066B8129|nr:MULTISPECIES: type II CAAX endopeptidase family protein [Streptococcus]MCP9018208.1 CPBP family intramembrane metalloprotease [Streptococcus sp. CF8-6]
MKNISFIFIKVLTCFLLTFAIQVVPLTVVRRFYDGAMGDVFSVGVFFLTFFICLTILVYLIKRWGDETTLDCLPIKWVELKWIVLAYLANLVLVVGFILFMTVLGKVHDNTSSLSFFQHLETRGFLYTFLFWLSTAFTQPLLEEMLFRGIILGTLEKYSPIFAVFLSAVLFGFAHDGEIISQHLVTGIVLGSLYIKRRNLYSCVVVHGLMNATVTCLFFLAT